MPKIIDHKQRKEDILTNALEVFAEKGYENTNLQQIADRCNISRPTLYQYFNDKEDIFHFSIKQITDMMQYGYLKASRRDGLSPSEKLRTILNEIVGKCYNDRSILTAILNFIQQAKSEGLASEEIISRRTIKLRLLLARIIRSGVKKGDFYTESIDQSVNHIFTMLETFLMQMTMHEKIKLDFFIMMNEMFVSSLERDVDSLEEKQSVV